MSCIILTKSGCCKYILVDGSAVSFRPHLWTGESIAKRTRRGRRTASGGSCLSISQAGFQPFIIRINLESFLVGRDGVLDLAQAKVSGAEPRVAFGPVRLQLNGFLSVLQSIGVVV
ncbi:hypothetical protein OIU78_009998 [Salix suchowensis]|nr:hypothetical protein OIU78_009998 [Salix suchowensis]